MVGSSAEEMLERYTRLIEHDDPLARSVDNLVKIALEKEDMLDRYTRFIQHRKPLAFKVDELIQIALAQRDVESGKVPAVTSAAGKILADLDNGLGSLAAVDGRIDSPIDLTEISADKVAAVDKALADPDIEMAMDNGPDSAADEINTSDDSDTFLKEPVATSRMAPVVELEHEPFKTQRAEGTANVDRGNEHDERPVPQLKFKIRTARAEDTAAAHLGNEHDERLIVKLKVRTAGAEAVPSSGPGVHRGARMDINSPHYSVTAHREAVASSGPAHTIDQAMTGMSHKRKSTQDHEATNKSRKTRITVPVTGDPDPVQLIDQAMTGISHKRKSTQDHEATNKSRKTQTTVPATDNPQRGLFHTSISSTSSTQIRKQADNSSAEEYVDNLITTRKPNAVSMIAGNESTLSRLPSRLQVPVGGPMHRSTDTLPTDDKTSSAKGTEDVSATVATVAETWAGVRLVDISASTSSSVFVLHLRKAMTAALIKAPLVKRKATDIESSTGDDAKDLRTEYVDVIHATMRVQNARRLKAGLHEIVDSADKDTRGHDFSILNDEREDVREGTPLSRMTALYEQYNLGTAHNDDLWFWVRKMSIACRFISIYNELQARCSHTDSVAYGLCRAYLADRQASGGEPRKTNESGSQVVKSMTADILRKPGSSKFTNHETQAQRHSLQHKLNIFGAYEKIATTCGGPGIFCLLPEKCVAKITLCGVSFRDEFLQNFAAQVPAYKELSSLLTANVLIPVILGNVEALKRLPLYNARLTSNNQVAMPTWHELLSLPAAR